MSTPRNRTALTDEVGWRLAALIDGEGCFSICRQVPKSRGRGIFERPITPRFRCEFVINMRADDLPFLERMMDETGLGRIYLYTPKQTVGRANQPKARWIMARKEECLALVDILDRYPLWSKKHDEYQVWREAVVRWPTRQSIPTEVWQRSYDQLRSLRPYREAIA